jgi:hypothetical protein
MVSSFGLSAIARSYAAALLAASVLSSLVSPSRRHAIRPCGCLWGATCGPAQQQRSGSGGSSSSRRQPHQLVQKSACCFIVLHSCIRDSCSLQRLCKISKAAQSQSARGFWHKRLTLACCCADYTPLRLSLSSRPSSIHPHYHHNLVH